MISTNSLEERNELQDLLQRLATVNLLDLDNFLYQLSVTLSQLDPKQTKEQRAMRCWCEVKIIRWIISA